MNELQLLPHHSDTTYYRRWVNAVLGKQLRTPNCGILVTKRTFPHRKFARLHQQLQHNNLSDMELRDLFGGYSNSDYNNRFHRPDGVDRTFTAPGNQLHKPQHWNNLSYLCHNNNNNNNKCNAVSGDCEWVSWDGPYGHTSIETLTRSPLHAMTLARRLIMATTPHHLVWFTRYVPETRSWTVTRVFPAQHLRRAILLGQWPFYHRG